MTLYFAIAALVSASLAALQLVSAHALGGVTLDALLFTARVSLTAGLLWPVTLVGVARQIWRGR